MGRPSKLTEKQWAEIQQRLLKGEKAADLSREFGVSKTRISERFSERTGTIRNVAEQLVSAEGALRALPVSEQVQALNLADELRAISMHLAGAAKYSAATAHRLSGIAHAKVQEIDDAAPLNDDSREALKDVAVLTKIANDAAVIPTALLSANKEIAKELNQGARAQPKRVTVEVIDASLPDATA